MDILDQRALALIPRWARWTVMGFLAAATLVSAGAALWLALTHGSDTLAVALLSIFKASAIGCALWFFFLMGQRAQSRHDLLRRTSAILAQDIPDSLNLYGIPDAIRTHGRVPAVDGKALAVTVDTQHAPGTVHARYIVKWPGMAGALELRVHLNVKVLSVVYVFPGTEPSQLDTALKGALSASANMDWKEEFRGLQSPAAGTGAGACTELWLRMKLSPDFLHEPTEQLFVTNDLAAMTRAIVTSWNRRPGTAAT
ncbi:MAG: hypothetical protein EPN38_07580 [Rhodanobacteraceae bacterium]|nr:MAG: hypothetical protein EPN38_07580 [Rhodanobacteraceae bacterium]